MFILYGISGIVLAYCMTHIFNSPISALAVTIVINFIIGGIMPVLLFVLWCVDDTRDFARK